MCYQLVDVYPCGCSEPSGDVQKYPECSKSGDCPYIHPIPNSMPKDCETCEVKKEEEAKKEEKAKKAAEQTK